MSIFEPRYPNEAPDLQFGRATATLTEASPLIPLQANITSIQLSYDLHQKDNIHARFVETRGAANITVQTTAANAVPTAFRWNIDPVTGVSGVVNSGRIDWGTGFEDRVSGQGANGVFVQGLLSVVNSTTLIFSFTPPAATPAQLYTFNTAILQSTVKY